MKIHARVVTPDGYSESRKIVEARLDGVTWRKPDDEERRAVLAWARERGVDTVAFDGGPTCVRACRECGEPVDEGPTLCEWCSQLDNLLVTGIANSRHNHTYSQQEVEHRAQLAERLSVKLAQLAIELQEQATRAPARELEVVDDERETILNTLERILRGSALDTAEGGELDRIAALVGLQRLDEEPGALHARPECDDHLRLRMRNAYRTRCPLHGFGDGLSRPCGCEE